MNRLCPARLEPVFHQRPWGARSLDPLFPTKINLPEPIGEAWMTSAECRFADGPYQGKSLGEIWRKMPPDWTGTQFSARNDFPLLVKFIFAEEKLSVQVHPDDDYASRHELAAGGKGKTEMWHVLRARAGAEVLAGLNEGVTRESFESAIASGTAQDCLARVPVSAGDTVFIPAGTPHTIGAGLVLCEIQQYSDLTYRVYDYNRRDKHGRARELHIEKALSVIRFGHRHEAKVRPVHMQSAVSVEAHLLACRYFAAEKWEFAVRVPRSTSREHFDLLIFLEGAGDISWGGERAAYAPAEAWFLPAGLGDYCLTPASNTSVIRAYVPGDLDEFTRRLGARGVDEFILRTHGISMSRGDSVRTREKLPVCAVLLAGGRGTRFWPRSRAKTPKQLLNIIGKHTMLRQTAERLRPLVQPRNLWAVTNDEQAAAVRREMSGVPASHILAEPAGRNTAAAIALAAFHLSHEHGDALMAVLPSDAHIAEAARYRALVRQALEVARVRGNMVVLGIPPTRPETGYGYIERGAQRVGVGSADPYPVLRFTEKPAASLAEEYVRAGNYLWNAGMFFWRVSTFLDNLKEFLPATHHALAQVAGAIGTSRYLRLLRRIYPKLENISVDYAIMERATRDAATNRVFVIPAEVGWSDIGSWAAVYELLASAPGANVSAGNSFSLDAAGNFLWSPKKLCAAIGVSNVVLVETDDALLLCSRDRSQDVGKIVKWLEERRLKQLL